MQIGIISDTHDRLPTLRAALEQLRTRGISTVIHPGDIVAPFTAKLLADSGCTAYVTFGNNDGERVGLKRILPQIQDGPLFVELAGQRILVHHFIEWCRPEDLAKAEIVVTGHTHAVDIREQDGKLLINPGECCGWQTGRATIAVLDLATRGVELIEVPT